MRRREFIRLIGGAAAAWPLAARAQQPNQMQRIGVLMAIEADDPLRANYVGALLEGLRTFDWVEGRNIQLKYGWAGGNVDRIKKLAKELAASRLDAILAHTSPVTLALKSETTTTPIVFVAVTEPVAQGMITSLAHPGGNITGFTNFEFSMGGKWLQILKEIVPKTNQAVVMFNPDTAPGAGDIFLRSIDASAKSLAIGVTVARVRDPAEIEAAISALSKSSSAGLIVPPDVFLLVHRDKIIELAARYRVPTIYQYDNFTMGGGLVSYGVDVPDMFRRAGSYFDRILKGVSPAQQGRGIGNELLMLGIGRALMSRPRLLMLDEPSQGIMPKLVDEIFGAIQSIRSAGVTIILVEQRLRFWHIADIRGTATFCPLLGA